MLNVLADLAIESEAATATALRLARAYDEEDNQLRRFATAVLKYWVCKRATPHAVEALECLGGNGYVEESPMPQLLRDAPLNGIWEGSGNVMSLDVLRALAREPEGLPAFLAECELARGADRRLDAHLDALPATLQELGGDDPSGLRAPRGRGPRGRLPGLAARAHRARRGVRRVLRRPPRRRPRPRVRHAAARNRRSRDRRAGASHPRSFVSSIRTGTEYFCANVSGVLPDALDVVGVLLDVGAGLVRRRPAEGGGAGEHDDVAAATVAREVQRHVRVRLNVAHDAHRVG